MYLIQFDIEYGEPTNKNTTIQNKHIFFIENACLSNPFIIYPFTFIARSVGPRHLAKAVFFIIFPVPVVHRPIGIICLPLTMSHVIFPPAVIHIAVELYNLTQAVTLSIQPVAIICGPVGVFAFSQPIYVIIYMLVTHSLL